MKTAKEFFKNNMTVFLIALVIFVLSISAGTVVSLRLGPDDTGELKEYIVPYLENDIISKISFADIFKTSAQNHLKFIITAAVGAVNLYTLPLFLFAFVLKGYQLGFTIGFISDNFGPKGIAVALSSVIVFYLLSMPVYFLLFTIETNYVLKKSKLYNGSKGKNNIFPYFIFLLIIYFFLCVFSLVESVLTPLIISFIN